MLPRGYRVLGVALATLVIALLMPGQRPAQAAPGEPEIIAGGVKRTWLSPDRRTLVYLAAAQDESQQLYSVPADGSRPPRPIGEPGWRDSFWYGDLRLTFSADSSRVVYYYFPSPGAGLPHGLLSAPADGGAAPIAIAAAPPGQPWGVDFQLAPDGRRVVYLPRNDASPTELFSAPLTGPGARIAAAGAEAYISGFAISADSREVVYATSQASWGGAELYRAPVAGGAAPRRLVGGVEASYGPAFALAGRRVVYLTSGGFSFDSLSLDSPATITTIATPTLAQSLSQIFQVSPDGRYLVYQEGPLNSDKGGVYDTFLLGVPVDGSAGPAPLGSLGYGYLDFWFSPDGRWVVSTADEGARLARVDGSRRYLLPYGAWSLTFEGDGLHGLVSAGPQLCRFLLDEPAAATCLEQPHADRGWVSAGPLVAPDLLVYRVTHTGRGDGLVATAPGQLSAEARWVVPPGAGRTIEWVDLAAGGAVFFVADRTLQRAEILPTAVGLGGYTALVRESAGALELTISLSHAAAHPVAVAYRVVGDSALVGEDVAAASGALSFAAGELRKPIRLRILDSPAVESAERFTVELYEPAGAALGVTAELDVVVLDDDGFRLHFPALDVRR